MSWQDGYECYSTADIDKMASSSERDHPILVLLAHDGDNAFGGGYSYYRQCVSDFVNEAQGKVSAVLCPVSSFQETPWGPSFSYP